MEETAKAQADAAKAQAKATKEQAKANLHTEQGQRQERLKNAIEHLGHEKDSVRLGGAYELFHLAEDAKEDAKELRQTVLDILCAHIRHTTGEKEYREHHKSKPLEEVQSILRLLFVQEYEVFKGCDINLQGSWLNGANLVKARLEKAVLTRVHLQGAKLAEARLQGAILQRAKLQCADMRGAWLQGALLLLAQLQEADIAGVLLHGVVSRDQGPESIPIAPAASIPKDQIWRSRRKPSSFVERLGNSIDKESDLSTVIFEGRLNQEYVDYLVEGLSDERANELRERLEPHVDRDSSNQLPTDSGANTGAYPTSDAEIWINEYEEAMSEVPEDDN